MNAFFWRALILGISLALILAAGCSDDEGDDSGEGDRVQVLTTLPLLADFVENVGGERVAVTPLLPGGADPHTFEPAPRDVAEVAEADIVFVNGLDLEPAAINIIEPNLPDGVPLVRIAESLYEGAGADEHADGEQHPEGDPHLWMDPRNAKEYAAVIRDELSMLDPDGAPEYQANYEDYAEEIDAAAENLRDAADAVPADNRKLIVTHDAFGHLAGFIGFEIAAFVAAGPGQDPSPDDIRAIVETIEDEGIPAVFTEPQISGDSETLERIAGDTGATVCTLYSDAFSDEIMRYVEMVRHNADELRRCLGG